MRCPSETESILLKIIAQALLRIRALGFTEGDANKCAIEADHVHNLPMLIENYSEGGIRYYLDVYRKEYIRALGSDRDSPRWFQPLWDQLESLTKTKGEEDGAKQTKLKDG